MIINRYEHLAAVVQQGNIIRQRVIRIDEGSTSLDDVIDDVITSMGIVYIFLFTL